MPRRKLLPPQSFTAQQGLCPLCLDYPVDLIGGFDVYSGIMRDIPAARYRERVMTESHEATEAGKSKDPSLDFRLSVHLAEGWVSSPPVPRPQPMSDVSRRGSFGWRPSDILNSLGLDNPVSGCQLGSILEASRSWQTAFICVSDMNLTKEGSF